MKAIDVSKMDSEALFASIQSEIAQRAAAMPTEEATKPRSVRLNDARWEKLKRLGAEWLAKQIDKAKEPQ